MQQDLEALSDQQLQTGASNQDVEEKERNTRGRLEALLQKECEEVPLSKQQESVKNHACCGEAMALKEEALCLLKNRDEAVSKEKELLAGAVVKLQELQRFQREATVRLERAEKKQSEQRVSLESAEEEIEALQEEREDLLLRNSALDAAFEQKHAEVVALQERLSAKNEEIRRAVSLAACGECPPAAPLSVVLEAQGAVDAALADLGTALRPASEEGVGEPEGSRSLLSEDRQSVLLLEDPASEYGDVLHQLSRMGLHLGPGGALGALPGHLGDLEPPLPGGRRELRAELDALDNEIALVQARGGFLFPPGDAGLTP